MTARKNIFKHSLSIGLYGIASTLLTSCASVNVEQSNKKVQPLLSSVSKIPYVASSIKPNHFTLNQDISFYTQQLGDITLTKGFSSDGSSSPIQDVHGSRLAGMLHDALYTFSSHLRFEIYPNKLYSKATADQIYCQQMATLKVPLWHRSANCSGVSIHPRIHAAWEKYKHKRKSRWLARKPSTIDQQEK